MRQRVLLVGFACLLAVVVLGLTLLTNETGSKRHTEVNPSTNPASPLPGFDPTRATSRINRSFNPVSDAKEYRFERLNRRGQLLQVFGQSLTPLPQGVSSVVKPMARLHSTPTRVLEIRADRGTFVAPENQPRSGEFSDNVVLTLFEGPKNRALDFSEESKDIKLRVYLQDARFDLELGQVDSNGPVHLTTERADFRGTGLSLTYNELRSRVERLEIARGQQLRVKPGAARDTTAAAANTQPATRPAGKTTNAAKPTRDEPAQFYRARLEQRVRVRSPDVQAEGDRLELCFSLNTRTRRDVFEEAGFGTPPGSPAPGNSSPSPTTSPATKPQPLDPSPQTLDPTPDPSTVTLAAASGPPAAVPEDPLPVTLGATLAPVGPEDLIITWTGKLTVDPEDNPAALDLLSPEDIYLSMNGRPTRIVTPRQEILTVAAFDYASSNRRIRLTGDAQFPLVFDSTALGGVLTAQGMTLHQAQGTGQIVGPGTLRSHGSSSVNPLFADNNTQGDLTFSGKSGLPRGSTVAFKDALDLTFFLREPGSLSRTDPALIRALRSATFRGDVAIHSPDFDLQSDTLAIGLEEPTLAPTTTTATTRRSRTAARPVQKQAINSIHASGNVRVANRSPIPQKQLTVESDDLLVDLQRSASGNVEPRRLIATGNVLATQPGRLLKSGYLDVFLDPLDKSKTPGSTPGKSPSTSPATAPAPDNDLRLSIRSLVAKENVHIDLDNPLVSVDCDRLSADIDADQLELFGWADKPATLTHNSGTLVGPYIVMGQRDQTAHVVGPGSFSYTQSTALPGRAKTGSHAMEMTVTWADTMHFDNRAGFAHFLGKVKASGKSTRDTSTLVCDDLKLEFSPLPERDPTRRTAPVSRASAATRPALFVGSSERALRNATAAGSVILTGTQTAEGTTDVNTRLRIEGPLITFDNAREQMQVIGAGKMLTEDYRKIVPVVDPGAGGVAGMGGAFNAGGATLFTWGNLMTADFLNNDLRLGDKVQVVHRAIGANKPVQIDAQRLWADMESAGGIGGWVSKNAPKPRLMSVLADGAVRLLTQDATVFTDHLKYTGLTQEIKLTSDAGRLTRMQFDGQPNEARSPAFKAQFREGRLTRVEIERPEPGPISAPRR
jgi:lipopolysaccharide export system protein LptA